MIIQNQSGKARATLLVAMGVGVALHIGFFTFLRLQLPGFSYEPQGNQAFSYVGQQDPSDRVLQERAVLFDSAPLFMPTKWNEASDYQKIVTLRQATEAFGGYSPLISLNSVEVKASDLMDSSVPLPLSLLPESPSFFFANLGRTGLDATLPNSNEGLFALVYSLEDGSLVAEVELPSNLQGDRPNALWEPAQWTVQIETSRRVGPPLLIKESGFSDWDEALSQYLGSLGFYRHLPNGYFRVLIAP